MDDPFNSDSLSSDDSLINAEGQVNAMTYVLRETSIYDPKEDVGMDQSSDNPITMADPAVSRGNNSPESGIQKRSLKRKYETDTEVESQDEDEPDGNPIMENPPLSEYIEVEKKRRGDFRELVTKLTIAFQHKEVPNRIRWKCSAKRCNFQRINHPQRAHVFKHAMGCKFLDNALQAEARDALAKLGEKEPRKRKNPGNEEQPLISAPVPTKEDLKKQSKDAQDLIVMMICCDGLVPKIMERPRWKEFIRTMNPNVEIPSRYTFAKSLLLFAKNLATPTFDHKAKKSDPTARPPGHVAAKCKQIFDR